MFLLSSGLFAQQASPRQPGELRAISRKNGRDLSFITVEALDVAGNPVPEADQLINFELQSAGIIAGVDNGDPISHAPFKASYRQLFHGKALVIVQAGPKASALKLTASAKGLQQATLTVNTR